MKYRAICPNCKAPQTRLDYFSLSWNYPNNCRSCNSIYRIWKLAVLFDAMVILICACILFVGVSNIWNWLGSFALFGLYLFASPYIVNLRTYNISPDKIQKEKLRALLSLLAIPIMFGILSLFASYTLNGALTYLQNQTAESWQLVVQSSELIPSKLAGMKEHILMETLLDVIESTRDFVFFIAVFGFFFIALLNFIFYLKIRKDILTP